MSGQVVVGLLRTFSTLTIQMVAKRGAAREIGLECATARSVRVMITCFLFFNHPLALSICTAPAKRVSEIGVTPGDVFFDSSDDDVDPPPPVRAPVIEKSPSASPVPMKNAAKPVRPGGVLWDSDDE